MPMMPFIGVRISWLTVARKRDLAWLAILGPLARVDQRRLGALAGGDVARDRAMRDLVAGLVAHRQLDPREPARALRACGSRRRSSSGIRHRQKAASGTMPTSTPSSASVWPTRVPARRRRRGRRTPCWCRRSGPSRSRWTTRSPSASISPRKRSSLSCSSHIRSAKLSISARLRAVARVDLSRPAGSRRVSAIAKQGQPATPMPNSTDGDEVRRAEQIGNAGSDQDGDDDEETAIRAGWRAQCRRQRRRGDMHDAPAHARESAPARAPSAALFIGVAGFRRHALRL